ncbi:MAG: hypothetical protein ACOCVF_01555 [bacterium]
MSQHLVFHKQTIYSSFFINIKTVPEYKTFNELEKNNTNLAQTWLEIQRKKDSSSFTYETNAQYYPEFAKIVTISFGVCNILEDGTIVKNIKKISDDEVKVIRLFSDILNRAYNHNKNYILVGHNINGFHIPMFIRRFIKHNEKLTIKVKKDNGEIEEQKLQLPPLIKNAVMAKPWDRNVIDTLDTWKFGGNDYTSLSTIATYMALDIDYEKNLLHEIDNDMLGSIYYSNDKDTVATFAANEIEILMKLLLELRKI